MILKELTLSQKSKNEVVNFMFEFAKFNHAKLVCLVANKALTIEQALPHLSSAKLQYMQFSNENEGYFNIIYDDRAFPLVLVDEKPFVAKTVC